MVNIHKLRSGVTLITDRVDSVMSVSTGIWCANGSVNEPEGYEGISHFIEHMLFKGTTTRTAYQIVDEIDSLGGQVNAFTGKESTCFYVKCLSEHFEQSADVLTDMIENPLFDPDEMEREKLVVIEEINMNQDDPDDVALDMLDQMVFKDTGLAHPVLGTKETVSSFTPEIVREYYFDHYSRDAIVVSVCGLFDEDYVVEYFDSHFANLHETRDVFEEVAPLKKKEDSIIYKDIEQAHIAMGVSTISAENDDRYALSVLSGILGGGMSSRLFQNIRELKGLAYSVYTMNGYYTKTGEFIIAAGVGKDRADEYLKAVKEELDKLAAEPVSEKEFLSSREQIKAAYIFRQESIQSRMIGNGRNYLALKCCPTQEYMMEAFDSLTLDDVERVKAYITDYDSYCISIVTGK